METKQTFTYSREYNKGAMKNVISYEEADRLCSVYANAGGDFRIIEGTLLDNYILFGAKGYRSMVIKSEFVNTQTSINTFKMYIKLPKKYEKVIELLDADELDEAERLFFS